MRFLTNGCRIVELLSKKKLPVGENKDIKELVAEFYLVDKRTRVCSIQISAARVEIRCLLENHLVFLASSKTAVTLTLIRILILHNSAN